MTLAAFDTILLILNETILTLGVYETLLYAVEMHFILLLLKKWRCGSQQVFLVACLSRTLKMYLMTIVCMWTVTGMKGARVSGEKHVAWWAGSGLLEKWLPMRSRNQA